MFLCYSLYFSFDYFSKYVQNFAGQKSALGNSRVHDWVHFNIKSLGDSSSPVISGNQSLGDSDSGFEQSSPTYIEPWTNYQPKSETCCHREGDKVKIFVAGPEPACLDSMKNASKPYKSLGPHDERFYGKIFPLELRQYNNDSTQSKNFLFFKLPRFFTILTM